MLKHSTVFILGAGASVDCYFPTGSGLLKRAQELDLEGVVSQCRPSQSFEAVALSKVLQATGDSSIDAMLEAQTDIRTAGKRLIARLLLQYETLHLRKQHAQHRARMWYGELWRALRSSTIENFRSNPASIFTFNYDRSLEWFLLNALSAKHRDKPAAAFAGALDCIGPWHVHGQLGSLPELAVTGLKQVPYGGDEPSLTDGNIADAADGIRIVDEVNQSGPPSELPRLWDALSKTSRVVFLGFGFAEENVRRLRLTDCLPRDIPIWTTALGSPRFRASIPEVLGRKVDHLYSANGDILSFLADHPEVLESH